MFNETQQINKEKKIGFDQKKKATQNEWERYRMNRRQQIYYVLLANLFLFIAIYERYIDIFFRRRRRLSLLCAEREINFGSGFYCDTTNALNGDDLRCTHLAC